MQLIPHTDHLEVNITDASIQDFRAWEREMWLSTAIIINDVPVIGFISLFPSESFFIHLNGPALALKGPMEWIHMQEIELRVTFFVVNESHIDPHTRKVKILRGSSNSIRKALSIQKSMTSEDVDAAVDHLYDTDIRELEFLKSPFTQPVILTVLIKRQVEGGKVWLGQLKEIPEVTAQGASKKKLLENIKLALELFWGNRRGVVEVIFNKIL